MLQRGTVGETYHVGSGVEASIMEIADLVLDVLGKPASLKEIVPDRPGHDRRYLLDSSKLRSQLGWAPDDLVGGRAGPDAVEWYAEPTEPGGSRCAPGPRSSRAAGARPAEPGV